MSNIPRIDVHHHIIPPQLQGVGAGLKGMKVPTWSIQIDRAFNNTYNIASAIYSVSTPGVTHITDPEEGARVARTMNEYSASLRDANPKNGFFATVPSLQHTDLVLEELRYAFDTLQADGVTLFTSYATPQGYLGHAEYVPIWEELNRRKAVVFVHPINNVAAVYFDERLPMPAFDWPHETGRTAMDLILNRRLEQFPDVKIILSHAGGTLAALVQRATMIALPEFGDIMSAEDIVKQAKQFYFDTALSGSQEVFPLILSFAKPGHLLFGSDFPHAPEELSQGFTKFVDAFPLEDQKKRDIYYEAGLKLFPRLQGSI
ncbi:6-methylsalicylic acid decarboxylase [Fusarium oxysporum f. sp. rapae]|uniref:6-methylsalicylate decarboxylase n=1 Tax=Fusarium oxysporum f. sp. rapae TaxID=485398 RepID=A0A8J5P1U3_FUSOX|nr:6-methylsalicylic acid decarboxylase [Fusarium oxysporum f. sp. rapae]